MNRQPEAHTETGLLWGRHPGVSGSRCTLGVDQSSAEMNYSDLPGVRTGYVLEQCMNTTFYFHVSTSLEARAYRISVTVLGPGLVHRELGSQGRKRGSLFSPSPLKNAIVSLRLGLNVEIHIWALQTECPKSCNAACFRLSKFPKCKCYKFTKNIHLKVYLKVLSHLLNFVKFECHFLF